LNALRRFIKTVPAWAFVCVLIVLFVQSANMYYNARMMVSGERESNINGHWIIDYVDPGGPVDKAGIKIGDTIVSCNHYTIEEWSSSDRDKKEAGDTLIFGMLRNGVEVMTPIVTISRLSMYPWVYWPSYVFFVLVSIASLYILFKKPKDRSVGLFFLFIEASALMSIGGVYALEDPLSMFIMLAFLFCGVISPAILIHFHLIFPKPVSFFNRYKRLPLLFYGVGSLLFLFQAGCIFYQRFFTSLFDPLPFDFILIGLRWGAFASIIAIATAIFQLFTIKDTLARNQLLIIVTGTIFGVFFGIFYAAFYDYVNERWMIYPNLMQFSMKISILVMIVCILIAIFRFRIWNIEVVLKKALLYLGATAIIICTYLLLLYLVELMTIDETNTSRFVTLAVSVMIFLVSRDRLQNFVEKVFHRETYDSATVVSEFEEKLAGAYMIEDLGSRILEEMDEIFHFKSFILFLKKEGMKYEPVFVLGARNHEINGENEITSEMERKLISSRVFSPTELGQIPQVLESIYGELIVPMVKDNEPFGFFLCGPKKSEKSYSLQDIRVLSLIAKRVIALFQTAGLYQNDLDRQLMLERERARISQDMHDDIGASLTRISMMSEMVKNREDIGDGARQWLGQISSTSRGLMEEMNQIIWALNPKNDNIEGLVTYIRRFAFEYLEPAAIKCHFDLPQKLQEKKLSVETRRNIYLAVREALHNVVKHSGAKIVDIRLSIFDCRFSISIKDDGKGFDGDKLEFPGNGLVNMKKRMNDIGGEIVIKSETGLGTEIELIVSLK
jgi:signal transduction histidine kinase